MLTWLDNANTRLDDAPPVFGDPKQIQTELSKLKVRILLICSLLLCEQNVYIVVVTIWQVLVALCAY